MLNDSINQRAEATIVQAAGDHVFEVTVDYVNMSRFTVKEETFIRRYMNNKAIYEYNQYYCNLNNKREEEVKWGEHLKT